MALTKLNRVSDAINDLTVKLTPLRAISVIRDHCPAVLEPSEASEFEDKQWKDVDTIIEEIKQIVN